MKSEIDLNQLSELSLCPLSVGYQKNDVIDLHNLVSQVPIEVHEEDEGGGDAEGTEEDAEKDVEDAEEVVGEGRDFFQHVAALPVQCMRDKGVQKCLLVGDS